jgi:hypothetical protein
MMITSARDPDEKHDDDKEKPPKPPKPPPKPPKPPKPPDHRPVG